MHIPVLLKETISYLDIKNGEIIFDGTLNAGGHSRSFCEPLGKDGLIIGVDQDETAIATARENLSDCQAKTIFVNDNFRNIGQILENLGIKDVNKIILDIGLSSDQLESSGRGFSFRKDEPLLMTFKSKPGPEDLTAMDILNSWKEEEIADILKVYGEERFYRKISKAIILARKEKMIETTSELVEIIGSAVPAWYRKQRTHHATKTFQALRIAANDEINALNEVLSKGFESLAPGGKMGVISFHSGEDRIVKTFFKNMAKEGRGKLITKKPIVPSREEVVSNPRSRSSKLRVLEKIQ
ncbi:MAG: 16S rRNA (cytosine(1402)-N(4))-methyltransferase RsmH [Patescibacteria group bacterium]